MNWQEGSGRSFRLRMIGLATPLTGGERWTVLVYKQPEAVRVEDHFKKPKKLMRKW